MGKIMVITGGGAGLGKALATRLADDGHELFLLGRTQAKLAETAAALGPKVHGLACDVADPAAVDAAFKRIAQQTSRIDILINNAGVFSPFFLTEATGAQISASIATNLAGPMYCTRAALPLMDKGGHIISIGSETVAVTAAMLGVYQASKAGLERYMKTLDQEVAPLGIRVTLIRAGKMYGPDIGFSMAPDIAQRFSEESLKLGIDNRSAALSRFDSVADVIVPLLALPDDINVPEIHLTGRHK